jgi:predicted small metal-binding protein
MTVAERWKQWSCVEYQCDFVTVAPDEDQIVAQAMQHIEEVHSSFELEEMILTVVEDVEPPAGQPGA